MIKLMTHRSKSMMLMTLVFSIFFNFGLNSSVWAKNYQQLHLNSLSPLSPLFERPVTDLKYNNGQIDPGVRLMPSGFQRTVEIDSTGGYMVVEERLFKEPFNMRYMIPLKEYINYAKDYNQAVFWNTQAKRYISGELLPAENRGGGLTIDIPVKIKSKAFQQIFGGDRVSLSVTGNINIRGGFRHEKRDEERTALTRGSDYNFKMEQTQQFQVQGNVGEKVTVSVDQNSERDFDFENTIKLAYKGYEDEIIQSIEAGNVSLSLPSTQFVTFSANNAGLFGIKTVSAIGNLSLTTITSQEKGENKKLSITGGATDELKKIQDYEFVVNKYFFVDTLHRRNYWKLYENGTHTFLREYSLSEIEVWKSGPNYPQTEITAWALSDSLIEKMTRGENLTPEDTSLAAGSERYWGYFKRLEKNTDYEYSLDLGTIRLNQAMTEEEVLAVAYTYGTGSDKVTVGDLKNPGKNTWIFKLIKPKNLRPNNSTWNLMRRNIYSVGRNVPEEDFEVTILFKSSSGVNQSDGILKGTQTKASYLTILGLDTRDKDRAPTPDNIIDNYLTIFRSGPGEIEFPFHQPFDPEANEKNVNLEDDKRCPFYSSINRTVNQEASKFVMEVKSKTRSATYQLGFNVIENSEEVKLNGGVLKAGQDYLIDYMTGTLTILREDATSPSANIDISYESNQFFQLEKKTLMGANLQYKINENDFINDNSFIGGTFLYLNERTLDQKVRVGQGPMRNMVWDFNTKLSFKPGFLTTAVDALPLIETKSESRLDFEAEVAQVLPNPNTLNNEATNDKDGVAYIDDFEGANRITPLGIPRLSWTPASCPEDSAILTGLNRATKMGRMRWYNPDEQVLVKSIWPKRETNSTVGQTVNVLEVRFDPNEALEKNSPTTNWGGIMRSLSAGYSNQSESKFIEVWLSCTPSLGKVHIDLGQISEDAIPNYSTNFVDYSPRLNTEDKAEAGIQNKLLDDDEDIGLDGMPGTEDYWDLNGDGIHQPDKEPFSNDDWHYQTNSREYSQINGTENNRNQEGQMKVPDTEDINGNGALDNQNDYFEYILNLNPLEDSNTDGYIQGGNATWRLYRIPLSDFKRKVGNPSLDLVEYVRIWINEVDRPASVKFAEINIVGNQWLEDGIYEPANIDTLDYSFNYYPTRRDTVIVTVINTHDNGEEYDPSVTGVSGVRDQITRLLAKEQSLVLRMKQTLPPGAEGIVQKTVPQEMDFIPYNRMKMFVNGGNGKPRSKEDFPNGKLEYFVRFGMDEYNYYEYRSNIFWGWDKRNFMDIDLGKLASLKENIKSFRKVQVTEGLKKNLMEVREDTTRLGDGSYYIRRVVNSPSLTNIRRMTLGIKNCSDVELTNTDSIEVWFNEWRLSEVKKDKGMAMRMRVDLALADLLTFNGQIQKQDADYHRLDERTSLGGTNNTSQTYGGSLQFGKLFPSEWALSLPVTFNFSESRGTPKYLASNDILYKDLEDPALKDAEVRYNQSQGWGINIGKASQSKNFLIKNTLDKIKINYGTGKEYGHDSATKEQRSERHSGGTSFSIDFGRRNYIEPFKWLGKGPLINNLSQMKLYYLPSQILTSLNGNMNKSYRESRSPGKPLEVGNKTQSRNFTLSRQIQTSYKMVESLNFTFTRSWASDFQYYLNRDSTRSWKDVFNGQFGTKTDDSQAISAKYNPTMLKWLTGNASYTANFTWKNNIQQADLGRSATSNNSLNGTLNFEPNKMIRSLFRISGSKAQAKPRPAQKDPNTQDQEKDKEKDKDNDKSKKPESKNTGPNFLINGLDKGSERIQRISFTYNRRENMSYNGLEEGFPSWAFRLKATEDPGLGIVSNAGASASAYQINQDYSVQTGVKIIENIDLNFKYRFTEDEQRGQNTTGGSSYNAFKGSPCPDWTLRWSGLEKLPGFKKIAQRVSLDHAYSGDFNEKWTTSRDNVTNETVSTTFQPLLGLTLNLKKEIGLTISYNQRENETNSLNLGSGGNRTISSDLSVRVNYSKRSGFRIPIPIWPFKNKEFKNDIDLSATFSSASNETWGKGSAGIWVENDTKNSWELKPSLRYSFSNRVTGGANLTISKTKNKSMGTTSLQEFSIDVNIAIRGN